VIFEVRRDDLRSTQWIDDEVDDLGEGRARLRVDLFALTANNVTYAVFGDAMRYWGFFPASDGWGRVPVWGFADVEASRVDGLAVGDRVYGYLPMATHVDVTPTRVTANGFVDGVEHRAALPPVYNQYQRVARDQREQERETAILRPLFTTSFLIDDWLDDDGFFGAESVVLASASSKTALGLAFLLSQREGIEVVGLTSSRNADFVRGVGYYDRTVTYDAVDTLPARPTAFVDMAGGGHVLAAVHEHLRDSLRVSCRVGATHWEDTGPATDLPGPAPSFFFAPDRVVKRRADWGPGGFDERVDASWQAFLASVSSWLEIVEVTEPDDIAGAWAAVLAGSAAPQQGFIVRM
jgi:hypothetical protein